MPRIVIDVGGINYDKDSCDRLLTEVVRQRDVALTAQPPDYGQAIVLAHLVGWMRYVIDNLWPADDAPAGELPLTAPIPVPDARRVGERWTEPVKAPQGGWTVPAEQVENSPDSDAPVIE